MDALSSKEYWYGVWKSTLAPLLKEYVNKTDNQLDDSIYYAVEKLIDSIFGPE